MSKNPVIDKFEELPSAARRKAGDFVEFLYNRYVKKSLNKRPQTSKEPISKSPFVGMWKGRDDMADSTEWVRKKRSQGWDRRDSEHG